jgi:gliding motility-associated-like protein
MVLEVSGTLTLNANIDVSGKGFRGGTLCTNPDGGCGTGYSNYYYAVSSGFGAEKGEGITMVSVPKQGGRGSLGNGGGGGNKHNSGGGGGGNYSAGGHGGNEASFCPPTTVGGDGGKGLDYITQHKVFMGGGGGGSDNNNGVGTAGTNGGGIIIIRAASIQAGSASAIRANGIDVMIIPNGIGDGAGGGGAGGTILLDVPNITGPVTIRANGGAGGGQNCSYGSCFGPGGGGGAGFIATSAPSFPAGVTAGSVPGAAGVDMYPGSPCYNTSYGATPGQLPAGIKTGYVFIEGDTSTGTSLNAGSSKIICTGDSVMIGTPPIGGLVYSWSPFAYLSSDSISSPLAFPPYTTSYTLTATGPSGHCSDSAIVLVSVVSCDTLSSLNIPNVFTPNGDGINDFFKIRATGFSGFHCSIYNRWGQKMYEWDNAGGSWNGKSPQGSDAPDGTYYYILEVSGYKADKAYRGFLTLSR